MTKMTWTQSSRLPPSLWQRLTLFATGTLPLVLAVVLAMLLLCALEVRFGVASPDWDVITAM
jgi:hypothetical protein